MVPETVDQNAPQSVSPQYLVGLIITYLLVPLVLMISAWDLGGGRDGCIQR